MDLYVDIKGLTWKLQISPDHKSKTHPVLEQQYIIVILRHFLVCNIYLFTSLKIQIHTFDK